MRSLTAAIVNCRFAGSVSSSELPAPASIGCDLLRMAMTIRRCCGGSTSCSPPGVSRLPPDDGAAGEGHAVNRKRDCGARAETAHHEAGAGAQGFPLSVARSCDRAAEPGLVR